MTTIPPISVEEVEAKVWEFPETNASQSYVTHGFFRYFGKLPPVVTGRIIDHVQPNGRVLDIMCGSGTTLVECCLRGIECVGVDVNPLSLLITRVKTTRYDSSLLERIGNKLCADIARDVPATGHRRALKNGNSDQLLLGNLGGFANGERALRAVPNIRNIDYWFEPDIQQELATISEHVEMLPPGIEKDFFKVAFLSIIRKVSNASPRIGRIFHRGAYDGPDSLTVLKARILEMISGADEFASAARLFSPECILADGRCTPLSADRFDLVVCHPPYFALYKYSSDVLRFELEWGGFERKQVVANEIVDGFKTTDVTLLDDHIKDMGAILKEARRVLRAGGSVCVITSNSTFKDERLPVIDKLIEAGCSPDVGLRVAELYKRGVKFAQATYHRSARKDKVTEEDFLVFFKK